PWPVEDVRAVAGVNSFGFGGTNAHVVLADASETKAGDRRHRRPPLQRTFLLPLSARSPEALRALAGVWANGGVHASLQDVCDTASVRRSHDDHRLRAVSRSVEELRERLDAFLKGEARPGMSTGRVIPGRRPKLVFVFSGMGPQWWGMGRRLLESEPAF